MSKITMYTTTTCASCQMVKKWLSMKGQEWEEVHLDTYPERQQEAIDLSSSTTVPVTVVEKEGGLKSVIVGFNPARLAEAIAQKIDSVKLQLYMSDKKDEIYDVLMIGAGPSALAAAIYTTREDLNTLLLEKGVIGGLAALTDRVDNYPGFPDGLTGMELAQGMEKQAERFGAKIDFGTVDDISRDDQDNLLEVKTEEGGNFKARSLLIATGTHYRELGIPGEKEYWGKGVHWCATCDGAFYRNKKLVVVGGGNSAIQESIFLTRFASEIEILVRSDKLRASEVLVEELEEYLKSGKIKINYNTVPEEILGKDGHVTGVKTKSEGKEKIFECDGVFEFIGLIPNTQFLETSKNKHKVELDEFKFVKTDQNLMTSISGVFASGDCRSGATMQIASATGEGATAALMIRQYLEKK